MLSRRGKKQPLHSISANGPPDEAFSERRQEAEICWFCQNEVFATELHQRLLSSQNQYQRSVSLKYSRLSQDAPCLRLGPLQMVPKSNERYFNCSPSGLLV